MRLVLVNEKLIGQTLVTPIYHWRGQLLMNKGTLFTAKNIQVLRGIGIKTTYIEDERDDISVQEIIDIQLKLRLISNIKVLFDEVKCLKRISEPIVSKVVHEIIENINLSENAFMLNDIGDTDSQLAVHSFRVCVLSILIGLHKGYDKKRLTNLGMAALLFDVGKLISDDENHAEEGYKLIKKSNLFPTTVYVGIYQHHENVDGSGFPQGLSGNQIHEFANIIHICDDYLSLIDDLNATTINDAIEQIMMNSTNKYGELIYKDFINSIYCYPNGLIVKLNNGLDAVVVMQNKNFPLRPVVGVYINDTPSLLNLLEHLSIFIEKIIL